MKVSITKLGDGSAVLVISGPGTSDILAAAEHLGVKAEDYVLEIIRHELKLDQLARKRKKK